MYRRIAGRYFIDPIDGAQKTEFLVTSEAKIPPLTIPSDMPKEEFEKKMIAIKARLIAILENYLKPQAPREINLPSKISKPLLALIEKGICHPDILNEAYVHVEEMLQQNGFDKFLKETNEFHDHEVNKLRKSSSAEGSNGEIGASPEQPHSSSSRKSSRDMEKRFGFLPTVDLSTKIRSPGTLMPASISQSFSARMQRSPSMGSNNPPLMKIQTFATNLSPLMQSPLGDIPSTPTRRIRSPSVGSITSENTGYVEGSSPKNMTFLKQRLEKEFSSGGEQSPRSISVLKQRLEKEMSIGSGEEHPVSILMQRLEKEMSIAGGVDSSIQNRNNGILEFNLVEPEAIFQLPRTVNTKRNFKVVPSSKLGFNL
jgi:Regulator of G protein signaling domain